MYDWISVKSRVSVSPRVSSFTHRYSITQSLLVRISFLNYRWLYSDIRTMSCGYPYRKRGYSCNSSASDSPITMPILTLNKQQTIKDFPRWWWVCYLLTVVQFYSSWSFFPSQMLFLHSWRVANKNLRYLLSLKGYPWIENPYQVNAWISIEIQGYPNGYPCKYG